MAIKPLDIVFFGWSRYLVT